MRIARLINREKRGRHFRGLCLLLPFFVFGGASHAFADISLIDPPNSETRYQTLPAQGGTLRSFTLNAGIDLSESYLTNVYGTAIPSEQKGDYYSRAALDLGLHDHTLRFSADATYTLAADYFMNESSRIRVTNYFNGLADAEIIPGHLFLDGRAFATPLYVSSLGALAPSGEALPGSASANVRDSYGYEAQPKLLFRLGDFAKSNLTAEYGAVYLVQPSGAPAPTPTPGFTPPPSNLSNFAITEDLSSGTDFNRMNWSLIGMDAEQSRSVGRLETREGLANLDYAVSREFWLLSTVGYQTFDASPPLIRNLNGLVAMGGVRFTLGPSFEASAKAGRQYNSPSYTGELHYEMTPTSAVVAAVTDTVTTPAARLLDNLNNLASTDAGTLVNSNDQFSSGAVSSFSTFDAVPVDDTSFDNVIARYRVAQASFLSEAERTHLSLTGFGVIRDDLSPVPGGTDLRQTSVGLAFLASRNLTPKTTATFQTMYTFQTILGGHDNIFSANGVIYYALAPEMSIYARAAYMQRQSSDSLVALSPENGNLSDAEFTIGIHRQLF